MVAGAPLLTLGVLGGMGPAATVDFLAKVVAATPARRDQDHVPTITWNCPQIPDRSAAILAGDDGPLGPLLEGVEVLQRAGADFIAIPCNSAHHWHGRLQARTRCPVVHIAEAAAEAAARRGAGAVGLLCTRGTLAAGIYQQRLGGARRLILPDDAAQVGADAAIAAVKSGRPARHLLEEAVARMLDRGAQSVLLACTELPLAARGSRLASLCIDATEALARRCVAMSYGQHSLVAAGAAVPA